MPSSAAPDSKSTPGAAIRAQRKRAGMTLADLSARTGLAVSTLSKLEIGQVSLSYDKLALVSKGLGIDMAQLLNSDSEAVDVPAHARGRRVVLRAGDGLRVETRSYDQAYLATELLNKRCTPMVVELHARSLGDFIAEFGDLIRHPGEEFAYVLEGEVEFHSDLYAPVRLGPGDSIYFDSEMGHAYLKATDAITRLVGVCAPRGREESGAVIETFVQVAQKRAAPAKGAAAKRRKSGVAE